jgi:hypothetical protein
MMGSVNGASGTAPLLTAGPSRLKPARGDKNKALGRGAEAPRYPNWLLHGVFPQTLRPRLVNDKNEGLERGL